MRHPVVDPAVRLGQSNERKKPEILQVKGISMGIIRYPITTVEITNPAIFIATQIPEMKDVVVGYKEKLRVAFDPPSAAISHRLRPVMEFELPEEILRQTRYGQPIELILKPERDPIHRIISGRPYVAEVNTTEILKPSSDVGITDETTKLTMPPEIRGIVGGFYSNQNNSRFYIKVFVDAVDAAQKNIATEHTFEVDKKVYDGLQNKDEVGLDRIERRNPWKRFRQGRYEVVLDYAGLIKKIIENQ